MKEMAGWKEKDMIKGKEYVKRKGHGRRKGHELIRRIEKKKKTGINNCRACSNSASPQFKYISGQSIYLSIYLNIYPWIHQLFVHFLTANNQFTY